jgi:hypothetical protein
VGQRSVVIRNRETARGHARNRRPPPPIPPFGPDSPNKQRGGHEFEQSDETEVHHPRTGAVLGRLNGIRSAWGQIPSARTKYASDRVSDMCTAPGESERRPEDTTGSAVWTIISSKEAVRWIDITPYYLYSVSNVSVHGFFRLAARSSNERLARPPGQSHREKKTEQNGGKGNIHSEGL